MKYPVWAENVERYASAVREACVEQLPDKIRLADWAELRFALARMDAVCIASMDALAGASPKGTGKLLSNLEELLDEVRAETYRDCIQGLRGLVSLPDEPTK